MKDNCNYDLINSFQIEDGEHSAKVQWWDKDSKIKSEKCRIKVKEEAIECQKTIRVYKEARKIADGKRSPNGLNWRVIIRLIHRLKRNNIYIQIY